MSSQPECDDALGAFLAMVTALSSSDGLKRIQDVFNDNASLREKNGSLQIAHRENLLGFGELQKALDAEKELSTKKDVDLEKVNQEKEHAETRLAATEKQLEQTGKDISDLQESLKIRDTEIEGLKESLRQEEERAEDKLKSVQQELESARGELESTNAKLRELEGFAFKMTELPKEAILQRLDTIFESAYGLVEAYFNVNLEQAVLDDLSRWENIEKHNLVIRVIPVILTNTLAAKQMRVAAVLAVLATALARTIFQPTYTLAKGLELAELMSDLANEDVRRESYLRAVLLAIDPERQKDVAGKKIREAVREVFECVGHLLSAEKQEEFRPALEDVCKKAYEEWSHLQRVPERIEPTIDLSDDDEWAVLPLPSPEGTAEKPELNGNGAAEEGDAKQGGPERRDIAGVVWPCFLSVRQGEPELVGRGFVLVDSQVKSAKDEVGSRRTARSAKRRAMSIRETDSAKAFSIS